MNSRPRRTAYHEAGHALAFWWNGLAIRRVTVRTRAEALIGPMVDLRGNLQAVKGLVEADYLVPLPAFEPPGIAEHLPSMIELIERDLLNCFAGPVAEAIYRHSADDRFLTTSGAGDLRRAHELIALLPARQVAQAGPMALGRCHSLLRAYWPVLRVLAERLREQGVLDGETLIELLCQLTGETPQRLGNPLASLDRRWQQRSV
ncbi:MULTISPECIES: hypothetical protein [unclassified Pseudomonas]|uniref:hypothetical protein n=1 Tax=unclassified Pseudomonas TaxID=196821 RepID=UPI001BCDD4F9|nr:MULTISPECIES: hypothetical protein [unclassified Pseudomonas]QVM94734.1 hypothetical protein JYG36_16575 [Pseudomonas sp. SORT22]UVL58401.1 hypothetical protein LOY22_10710 [Pseudomonas sp. B21-035]